MVLAPTKLWRAKVTWLDLMVIGIAIAVFVLLAIILPEWAQAGLLW